MTGILNAICDLFGVPKQVLDIGEAQAELREATCFERCISFIPSSTLFFVNDKGLSRLAARVDAIQKKEQSGDSMPQRRETLARAKICVLSLLKSGSMPASTKTIAQNITTKLFSTKLFYHPFDDLKIADVQVYVDDIMDELDQACKTGPFVNILMCMDQLEKLDAKHHDILCRDERFKDVEGISFHDCILEFNKYSVEGYLSYPGKNFYVYAAKFSPALLDWYCKELQLFPERLKLLEDAQYPSRKIERAFDVLEKIVLPADAKMLDRIPQKLKDAINSFVEQEGWQLLREFFTCSDVQPFFLYVEEFGSLANKFKTFLKLSHPEEFPALLKQHVPELQEMQLDYASTLVKELGNFPASYRRVMDLIYYNLTYLEGMQSSGLELSKLDPSQIEGLESKYDKAISSAIYEDIVNTYKLKLKNATDKGAVLDKNKFLETEWSQEIFLEATHLYREMDTLFHINQTYPPHAALETIIKSVARAQRECGLPILQTENLDKMDAEALIRMLPHENEEDIQALAADWGLLKD